MPKGILSITLASLALLATFIVCIFIGAAPLPVAGVFHALSGGLIGSEEVALTARESAILFNVRLPRVVLAALVGAALATAGAAYQAVFRNPLADPYLLGISSGASLAVTVGILFGVATAAIPAVGFLGGVAAVAVTYVVGTSLGDRSSPVTVILAGVAVAAFANAMQQFLLQRNEDSLRQVYGWMLGQLGTATWRSVLTVAIPIALGVCVIVASSRSLDVLSVGDTEAASLGLNVGLTRIVMVCAATLITAAAVSVSGLIGFVGIIVPHALRLIVGPGHRLLLPLVVLVGATFLQLADIVGRTVLAPAEVPVGVVTAAVGGPFFLFLLRRYGKSRGR